MLYWQYTRKLLRQGGDGKMVYELKDRAKAAPLFAGMEDSMIASCLQGMMDS